MRYEQPKITLTHVLLLALAVGLNPPMGIGLMFKFFRKYLKEKAKEKDFILQLNSVKEQTFRIILSRLKKDGLVENPRRGFWQITLKGKKMIDSQLEKEKAYKEFREANKKRDTVIIFDIPEIYRRRREALRFELIELGYEKLQQSVWIGGSPLPKMFIKYLTDQDLMDYVHIFSINRKGTLEN